MKGKTRGDGMGWLIGYQYTRGAANERASIRRDLSTIALVVAHKSKSNRRGSSTASLIVFKNVTASRPSTSLWSYVNATFIIGRATISFPTQIGRFTMECIPRMALCGGLMMGVPFKLPKTPPLLIVNVPPVISSSDSVPSLAFFPYAAIWASTSANDIASTSRSTGTTRPFGALTAIETS
eukprot:30948-Pelagococcus_subviridis.AAC.3